MPFHTPATRKGLDPDAGQRQREAGRAPPLKEVLQRSRPLAGLRVPPLQPPSASAALSKNFTLSSEAVRTNLAPALTDILPLVPTLLGRSRPFTPVSPSLIPASPAASRPLQAVSLSPRGLLEQREHSYIPGGRTIVTTILENCLTVSRKDEHGRTQ